MVSASAVYGGRRHHRPPFWLSPPPPSEILVSPPPPPCFTTAPLSKSSQISASPPPPGGGGGGGGTTASYSTVPYIPPDRILFLITKIHNNFIKIIFFVSFTKRNKVFTKYTFQTKLCFACYRDTNELVFMDFDHT